MEIDDFHRAFLLGLEISINTSGTDRIILLSAYMTGIGESLSINGQALSFPGRKSLSYDPVRIGGSRSSFDILHEFHINGLHFFISG